MNKKPNPEDFSKFMFDVHMKPIIGVFSLMETLMDNLQEMVPPNFYLAFMDTIHAKVTEALDKRFEEAKKLEAAYKAKDEEVESILDCLKGC